MGIETAKQLLLISRGSLYTKDMQGCSFGLKPFLYMHLNCQHDHQYFTECCKLCNSCNIRPWKSSSSKGNIHPWEAKTS